ncbi:MAG: TAT-variant-translocated molybdopterin oxidoreductase, partial [Caldilineaceae bacterium]|nr:TAT-variant-translocated molybdopterin oxidoreductase [Caldilineaceae bacterium]
MASRTQIELIIEDEDAKPQNGRQYWRSLDELVAGDGFQEKLRAKLPRQAQWLDSLLDPHSRRTFLKLMGASLAMAGLSGCVPKRRTELI